MLINPIPPDGGMLYKETDMAQLFPEPFNAITAVLFLAIAIFGPLK
jgi:hemolysin III